MHLLLIRKINSYGVQSSILLNYQILSWPVYGVEHRCDELALQM
jgi:hypothetical protein